MAYGVTVDIAGARMGGAARFKSELDRYLSRSDRADVSVIGSTHRVGPGWLMRRELSARHRGRHVALNNLSFVMPGAERWTLIRNALHFLTKAEVAALDTATRASTQRDAALVRLAALRADVLVVPSTAMAERVCHVLPHRSDRIVVRPHPVSSDSIPRLPRDAAILCPVLFSSYKQMDVRIWELLATLAHHPAVKLRVTAHPSEVPAELSDHPAIELVGRLDVAHLHNLWARSQAIYFPTRLESFGYPLAEARASGFPVIACDSEQNREIAGPALCGYRPGDQVSLDGAVHRALTTSVHPDPAPFDPDAYFRWLLGDPR